MRDLLDNVPQPRIDRARIGLESLTPRELEILRAAIRGETALDTAGRLGISARTAELHRQQVLSKMQVKNMTQAVRMIALIEREENPPAKD